MKIRSALLLLSLGSLACATQSAYQDPAADQRERELSPLSASLFPGDADVLPDDQIRAILDASPELPVPSRIALLHLQHQSAARFWGYGPYWTALLPGTRQLIATSLSEVLEASSRVSTASFLPSFLLPEKPSVAHLREAAARYQADAVFVFKSDCQAYERYRMFRASEAKAFCNVEAALLDIRTGIVPLTAQVLRDFTVKKNSSDANMIETVRRAETEALQAALGEAGSLIVAAMEARR